MKQQIDPRNEEILNSLDGVQRAKAPDFFYTRLKARMEKELLRPAETKKPWILRPAFAIAALAIVLLINAAVLFQGNSGSADPAVATETDSYQIIASEYSINDIVFEEVYR